MKNSIGINDDYISMWNDKVDFYYGYEYSIKKGKLLNKEGKSDRKWTFVYKVDNVPVKWYSTKELETFMPDIKTRGIEAYLMAGILKMEMDRLNLIF